MSPELQWSFNNGVKVMESSNARFETKVLDARFEALAAHLRAGMIADGKSKRYAKSYGDMAAAHLMPHFTDAAIEKRLGAPLNVIFPERAPHLRGPIIQAYAATNGVPPTA